MTIDYSREPQAHAASSDMLPCSPLPDEQAVEDLPDKISAYYSLAFPNFTYYVQTITITIGRRTVRPGTPSTSDVQQVDIDLGPLKSVSRLHARIEYDENMERFGLIVLGRNGAWVDGVWSGSGSRVPLGTRSQIQIATRVFHFVLPPPPAPENSPSPSSSASTTRHLSPSIDVTSLSPDSSVHSPTATHAEIPPLPNAPNEASQNVKPQTKTGNKKRKKSGEPRSLPPEVMPPRPVFTYAQLCYKAITALNGKATLQEICAWVSGNFDWYRYHEGNGWESSIRHNLSSNRAFRKMERCAGERGKGFFWGVDPRFEHLVKDQEGKASDAKGKGKNPKLLEPPLKRSVKGDFNSPLPPPAPSAAGPFTVTPLLSPRTLLQAQTGSSTCPAVKAEQEPVNLPSSASTPLRTAYNIAATPPSYHQSPITVPVSKPPPASSNSTLLPIPSDIIIPIVMGSATATDAIPQKVESGIDFSSPPIALQRDTIVLNPVIFSGLNSEQLKELGALGAKKAIEILQSYIVRFLKEKRKAESARAKAKKKKGKGSKKKDEKVDALTRIAEEGNQNPGPCSNEPSSKEAVASGEHYSNEHSLSPATEIARAVAPLRLSTPPPLFMVDGQSNEEIDIMGDSDEPFPKKRRVDMD